jgi:hypothetical protein
MAAHHRRRARVEGPENKVAKMATLDKRFTAHTAAKTGEPERTIQRDAARGAALGADLDRIAGTSLDRASELDALAGMSPEQRAPIIDPAVNGEEISAVTGFRRARAK